LARVDELLHGHQTVALDTSVFIYHLENVARYSDVVGKLMDAIEGGTLHGVTSAITLMELAVRPLQLNRPDIAAEYEVLLQNFPNLTIMDVDRNVLHRAAVLRAVHRLKPPDAIQVGTCLAAGATAFVTNDKMLRRVSGCEVILLDDMLLP
jgi:predicted nucleic acid-binding protein